MIDFYGVESAAPIRFFHISTDGTRNGVIHFDDADYLMANKICAVNAYKYNVHIICLVHMSSHSHMVVWAETSAAANAFAETYKKVYARYLAMNHGIRSAFKDIKCTPKPIGDQMYLKRCICYVLLNPVTARIAKSPEQYRWSSFSTYFNNEDDGVIDVSALGARESRRLLHCRDKMDGSGLRLDANGEVSLKSFIDYELVENLFGNLTYFHKNLAFTNCAEEEQKYVDHNVRYDDTELIAEIIAVSGKRFGKTEFRQLTKEEKYSIIPALVRKTGATNKRIARLMRVSVEEIDRLLGKN